MPTPRGADDFVLRLDRPLAAEFTRLLRSALESARAELRRDGAQVHDGIHEGRRALRRARAVLLLLRPTLAPSRYEALVGPLREAGLQLSPLRDAQSVIEAVERYRDEIARAGLGHEAEALLPRLRRRRNAVVARRRAARDAAQAQLAVALAEVDRDGDGIDAAAPWRGLRYGLRRTRRAWRLALAAPGDEAVHRLRQRARALWLMLSLFEPLWPAMLAAQAGEVRRLSQLLGAERDLVLLGAAIAADRGPARASVRLTALAQAERARLRRKAFRLGALLFAEAPDTTVRRLRAYHRVRAALPRGVGAQGVRG